MSPPFLRGRSLCLVKFIFCCEWHFSPLHLFSPPAPSPSLALRLLGAQRNLARRCHYCLTLLSVLSEISPVLISAPLLLSLSLSLSLCRIFFPRSLRVRLITEITREISGKLPVFEQLDGISRSCVASVYRFGFSQIVTFHMIAKYIPCLVEIVSCNFSTPLLEMSESSVMELQKKIRHLFPLLQKSSRVLQFTSLMSLKNNSDPDCSWREFLSRGRRFCLFPCQESSKSDQVAFLVLECRARARARVYVCVSLWFWWKRRSRGVSTWLNDVLKRF